MCIPGLHITLGVYNRIWALLGGALTELDLKLAKLKCGTDTPTESGTYTHFKKLLQKIEEKQFEVNTQRDYARLVDDMVTHSTLVVPSPQTSGWINNLREASRTAHKTLDKMVHKINYVTYLYCLLL